MADLTLTERVYALEDQVKELTTTLTERLVSVVSVEKPEPARVEVRKKRKKKVVRKGPQVRRGFVKDA